jgi:hypothetical protein
LLLKSFTFQHARLIKDRSQFSGRLPLEDAAMTNFLSIFMYVCFSRQQHDRVSFFTSSSLKAPKNTAYSYNGTSTRDLFPPTLHVPRPSKRGLLSTRRHAFASSNYQQQTQPTWACCEERERGRLALSLPSPALGTRYQILERHLEGLRLSAEE